MENKKVNTITYVRDILCTKSKLEEYISETLNRYIEDGDTEPVEMPDIEPGLFIEAIDSGWDDWGVCIYHNNSDQEWYTIAKAAGANSFAELFNSCGTIGRMATSIIEDFKLPYQVSEE